jgi:hypothetical protein
MVDETGPWILFGLCVAAVMEPVITPSWLAGFPRGGDVPALALLGMPAYVCAAGATPLAAVLIAKGISPGAAIAFLLTGPLTNLTTFAAMTREHGRRIALAFVASVGAVAIGLGYAVNALLPEGLTVPGAAAGARPTDLLAYGCLFVLIGLLMVSLLRQGPRGFVGQLASLWPHRHEHDDGCHDCCEHEHGAHDPCADQQRQEAPAKSTER